MKKPPHKPSKAGKPAEIISAIAATQKRADTAKKKAQDAKAVFKRARKAYKQAKKAAKAVRNEIKELKETLKAMKAVSRKKPAAPRKTAVAKNTARAKLAVMKPTVVEPEIAPTPAVPEEIVSLGEAGEQT